MSRDYDDYDYEEQLDICMQVLEGLKDDLGGEIFQIPRDDEDEPVESVFLAFERDSKKCRFLIDLSWGDPELQIRFENRLGTLAIYYNKNVRPSPLKPLPPEWADVDRREERIFLRPGLYMDEFPAYMDGIVSTMEKLPERFPEQVLGLMKKFRASEITIDGHLISLVLKQNIMKKDYRETADAMYAELLELAGYFEKGEKQAARRPKVYIEGRAVSGSGRGSGTVRCRYCNGLIINSGTGICSQCGASL